MSDAGNSRSGIKGAKSMENDVNVPDGEYKKAPPMNKPREFWLERKNISGGFWEAYEESAPGTIHVIEMSAYAALKEENETLQEKYNVMTEGPFKGVLKAISKLQSENTRLKSMCEKLMNEISHATKYLEATYRMSDPSEPEYQMLQSFQSALAEYERMKKGDGREKISK